MKTRNWIVLNVRDSTYALFRADDLKTLANILGVDPEKTDENGTYIGHRSPDYQVIEISRSTIYDMYGDDQ